MEENQKPEVKSQVVKFSTADIASPQRAKNKTPIVVLIILAIVLFVPIAVISYLMATGKLDVFNKVVDDKKEEIQEEQNVEDGTEEEISTDSSNWATWTGEYLSAKLPEGWSIIETVNGQGVYGFSQMAIADEDLKVVFTLDAISVVDISECSCTEYYTFTDTDPDEFEEFKSNQSGNCSITNIPITKSYSEFTMLGRRIRRIDASYYLDDKEGDEYFSGSGNCVGFTSISAVEQDTEIYLSYKLDPAYETVPQIQYSMSLPTIDSNAEIVDKILPTLHIIKGFDWNSEETAQPETKTYDQMDFTERQQFIVDMLNNVKTSIQDGLVFLQTPVTHVSYVSTESSSGMLTGYILMHNKGSAKESDFDQVINTLSTKGYAVDGLSVDSPSLKYQALTYFDSVCAVSRRWSDFPVSTKYGNVYDMYVFCGVGDIAAVDSADTEKVLNIIDDVTMIDFNGITSSVTVATKTVNDLDVFLKGKSLVPRTSSTRTTEDDLFFIDEVLKKLGYWYNPSARNVGYFKQASVGDQENRYYFDNKETYCKATWVDSNYRPLTIYCGVVE